MADLDRRLSVATNAIAYELYKDDGRRNYPDVDDESNFLVYTTSEETAFAQKIAERVLHDLDELDEMEADFFLAGAKAKADCE